MNVPKFRMKNPPLALVTGQIGFSYAPELSEAGERLRMPLKKMGLPIAEPRQEVNIQLRQMNKLHSQNVQQHAFWLFSSPDKTRGVAIGPKYAAFVVSNYTNFDAYEQWVRQVIQEIECAFSEIYFANAGLRYLNVFKPDELPSKWLTASVRGIPTDKIETAHFHHRYEFWCETEGGVMHARCTLEHGGAPPRDLNFASAMFPQKLLFDKKTHIYHMDIFENSRPIDPQEVLSPDTVAGRFREQHENIDLAFLSMLSDEGKKNFGFEELT